MRFPVLAVVVLAASACSSPTEPKSGVTLLVTNTTCQSGTCLPLHILGFPGNQPATPGGLWRLELGIVSGPSACLVFPPSAVFRVIGISANQRPDTALFRWTSADLMSLSGETSLQWAVQFTPTTTAFAPASAEGWQISLPGDGPAVPSTACQ